MAVYGVDIHAQYQKGISLPRLKAEGYSFVVDKASEGTYIPSNKDSSSAEFKRQMLAWVAETRSLGMIPGLYHWIKNGRAAEQARFFYALVREAGGPGGMLIQLDDEDDATYADTQIWAAEWAQLTGGHPILLYTGKWWWGPRGWDGAAITPYLWDSHYLTADADTIPDDPAVFAARIPSSWWQPGYGNWPSSTILQFTSQGDAGSLGNNVDLNVFRGSLEELLALTGGDMALTADERKILDYIDCRIEAMVRMLDPVRFGPDKGGANELARAVRALKTSPVDASAVAELLKPELGGIVKAALLQPEVLAAIAKAVTNEIGS